ncbi:C2H2-type domain-containing protein [Caenorhabditis elegans]|uniref:C2H2-type domain-containing protein n=1 Tax=Caenorhabditis elegans TaxID=6239 RepID=Q23521_CAEEL|nr:C2H2-type domain-containing protein [Caenorhabditis elegans]CCD73219.2 C2H2-type domain-containing protein [Caenorhabditis elegans]
MAAIIGGGPRKPPRIIRKNVALKHTRKDVRDDEGEKVKREGYEVQSGVLTVNENHPSNFKPKKLPGIANDVESYPCRFCEEKIFLTASGLEKHGRECHLQNLDDIMLDINTICGEWKKREFERLRSRDRLTMDKMRHEARAHQLVKAVLAGNQPTVGGEQYEACTICNMLVNIAHPTAMESHQRAHKKNDELRLQLIDRLGAHEVQNLTCELCSLVFPDDGKLRAHVTSHHTRRKKYICKFCGHISHSMSELNLHKNDVHNYTAWANVPEYLKSRRTFYQYDEEQKRLRRRTNFEMADEMSIRLPILGEISDGDTAGRVTCPECGLKLNRPRLLFKHMERVHMKSSFSCMVETGGLPTFELEVSNGEIFWTCCDSKFDNRPEFIEHRRLHIPTQHEEVVVESSEDPNDIPSTSQAMIPDEDANEAAEQHNFPQMIHDEHGNIQVLLPEGYDLRETYYIYDENGTKIQLVPLQQPDGTIDHHHLVPQFEINHEGEEQIIEEGDEMMALENAEIEGEVAENEYDQFQMDLGNDWDNMGNVQMILVNEDDTLEEEHVEDVDHQIIENVEGDEGVIEINGQPLFD